VNVISSSGGNDSVALIQWAHEASLPEVVVTYMDTGWGASWWKQRVEQVETLAKIYGFHAVRLQSIGMPDLVRTKKGWPGNAQQFCTAHLKGIPFLEWIEDADPERSAVVLIGKRRAESEKRKATPEFIESSEHHGGRKVWHPLYLHTDEERDELIKLASFRVPGIRVLPHRSLECNPCVNANRSDFLRLTPGEIERVNDLEAEIGKPMFRPKRFGALGIHGVIAWAKAGRDREGRLTPRSRSARPCSGAGYERER
jgi:3'-phosphoadenosine 5'-phosphosulfate sulfotransferase (PAPS reductase)/FAD synthetase